MKRHAVLVLIGLLLGAGPAWGATATLDWTPSVSPDVVGYNVYRLIGNCQSAAETQYLVSTGNPSHYEDSTVPGTAEGAAYQVTAVAARESEKSNRDCKVFQVQNPPPASGLYYTATTGNDGNSCAAAQNASTPKRTIRAGIGCLSAGNTLIVKAGTYAEALSNPFANTGTSWTQVITVKAETPGTVTLKPSSGQDAMSFQASSQKYVAFDGITVDAASVQTYGVRIWGPAHHVRFANSKILNAPNQGVSSLTETGTSGGNEFINVEVAYTAMNANGSLKTCSGSNEGNKAGYCHAFYLGTSNNLLDGVHLHHNNGYGVQFYPQGNSGNVIRNSSSHDNVGTGIGSLGTNNKVYNNVVYGNQEGGLLITESSALVAHNTVTGNSGGWGNLTLQGSGHTVKNNIILGSISGSLDNTNRTSGSGLFVGGTDYHLAANSAAINSVACLSQVPVDRDGVARPQGSSCDQGAYEYAGGTPPPPPPPPSDRDGDSVPDASDGCPDEPGPASNNGCPIVTPPPPPPPPPPTQTVLAITQPAQDGTVFQVGATVDFAGACQPSCVSSLAWGIDLVGDSPDLGVAILGHCAGQTQCSAVMSGQYPFETPSGTFGADLAGRSYDIVMQAGGLESRRRFSLAAVAPPPPPPPTDGDDDHDGVLNSKDTCPNTPAGTAVDANGCPIPPPPPPPTDSLRVVEDDGDRIVIEYDRTQCPRGVQRRTTGGATRRLELTCLK